MSKYSFNWQYGLCVIHKSILLTVVILITHSVKQHNHSNHSSSYFICHDHTLHFFKLRPSPPPLSLSHLPLLSSGSIKGRRSSYLLAITTERSKSCDEGLNTFREEGRVFS